MLVFIWLYGIRARSGSGSIITGMGSKMADRFYESEGVVIDLLGAVAIQFHGTAIEISCRGGVAFWLSLEVGVSFESGQEEFLMLIKQWKAVLAERGE